MIEPVPSETTIRRSAVFCQTGGEVDFVDRIARRESRALHDVARAVAAGLSAWKF
ncbi:hypothetical protein DT23_06200 [Thioclava indica]|uniref:Uncharacterized protein n=1 Tax=Thioclava indica TaxID=1353528 RepID=A0A074JD50_9RHOB|nr:hypothetical protein DT23_06200 [Thioclava indica]